MKNALVLAEREIAREVVERVDSPVVARALLDVGRFARSALASVDDVRTAVVHLAALPSHSDVRRLRGEVARLRAVMAEVEAQVSELRDLHT